MPNLCLNRLHVVGPADKVEEFVTQTAIIRPNYEPAYRLELHLVEQIERGVDPIEADRALADWLDSIGAGPPNWMPRFAQTRVLPVDFVQSDLSETERHARLAAWMTSVKTEASLPTASDEPEADESFSLHALRPVPDVVFYAGYHHAGRYWQAEHWGTRSDVFDVPPPNIEMRPDGRRCAVYHFETAWAPPLEALHAGSLRYPDVMFVVSYAEPGMDFYGCAAYRNGERYEPEDNSADELYDAYPFFKPPLSDPDWIADWMRHAAEGGEDIEI
jgi:hypothetical protein